MAIEKAIVPNNVPTTVKPRVLEIDESNRYVMNGADFGFTCHVRVHEIAATDMKRVLAVIDSGAFKAAMAKATREVRALAIDKNWEVKSIGVPTNILKISTSGQGVTGQVFDMLSLVNQVAKILRIFGAEQGASREPLKNAHVLSAQTEGVNGLIRVNLANGRKLTITITEEK